MIHQWRPRCRFPAFRVTAVSRSLPRPRPSLSLAASSGRQTIWTATPPLFQSLRQRRKDTLPTADTIYALSTASGRAAIAIIRISGPACLDIYGALCPDKPFPHPRIATLRRIKDPKDCTRVLDNGALVLYFPGPNTVTGDDVLELHVHGGPAIVRSILEAVPNCGNSRPRRRTAEYSLIRAAEPGEFTKRAFYNGRLDLTQAEALGETLAAETEQQRRLAVMGADSRLARRYEEWRKILLYARGELEALIDFSEDQHFDESPAEFMHSVAKQVHELSRQIKLHIHNGARGELLRNGINVALLGVPNAGKSSLLNLIVGRDAAIVSAEPGTTRDIVDVSVDIGGWLVKLGDMAGLRSETKDSSVLHVKDQIHGIGAVEREGIRRAKERALRSDLVIVVVALSQNEMGAMDTLIDPELLDAVHQCHKADKAVIFVINKVDLAHLHSQSNQDSSGLRQQVLDTFPGASLDNVFLISCKDAASSSSLVTGTTSLSGFESPDPGGVQTFLKGLSQTFTTMTAASAELDPSSTSITKPLSAPEVQSYWSASLSVSHRQSRYLQRCQTHLDDFLAQCATPPPWSVSEHVAATTTTSAMSTSSHHVDGHDDLVGENSPVVVEHIQGGMEDVFDVVTAAEHLRYAADCLAKITGRGEGGDVEDVLGVVFEK